MNANVHLIVYMPSEITSVKIDPPKVDHPNLLMKRSVRSASGVSRIWCLPVFLNLLHYNKTKFFFDCWKDYQTLFI